MIHFASAVRRCSESRTASGAAYIPSTFRADYTTPMTIVRNGRLSSRSVGAGIMVVIAQGTALSCLVGNGLYLPQRGNARNVTSSFILYWL
jgi:hypothetical protein